MRFSIAVVGLVSATALSVLAAPVAPHYANELVARDHGRVKEWLHEKKCDIKVRT